MRDLADIRILKGVSHVIAPRDPTQLLRLSEAEFPLEGGVGEILAAHVSGGLQDAQAKAAKFVDRRSDRACDLFAKLLERHSRLVEVSKTLATALYALVEDDRRITDGTLAILQCQATDATGQSVRFLAVLKLDPSETLHTVQDTDSSGRLRIRYDVDATSLPSRNEKIQKCVFVKAVDESLEFEMLVVDRQGRADAVSTFWVRDFLGADLVFDAPARTKNLYRALQSGRNAVEQDLTADQLAALDQVIAGAVVQSSINLDRLVAALPVPPTIRVRMDEQLSQVLPDREFDIDPAVSIQFVRRRSYRADNNLHISVKAEFADMIHVEDLESGTGDTRLRKVWFETRSWKDS